MGNTEPVENRSIDTSGGDQKHISVAENAMPSQRSTFIQRLKLRDSNIPERPVLHTRQNEVDSVLSIAEKPEIADYDKPLGKQTTKHSGTRLAIN